MDEPELRAGQLQLLRLRRRVHRGRRIADPGTEVGPFRVDRPLAAGSIGAVHAATQASLGRTVALRIVRAGEFEEPADLARFDGRQRIVASLHHPNLVPFYESGEWEGGRFVATRFVNGRTLAELIEAGAPPAAETLAPLADALATAHAAGLTHGRISARNVLIDEDGTPYLADLGLGQASAPEEDERALAELLDRLPAAAPARAGARPGLVVGAALIVAAAVVAMALTSERRNQAESPPGKPLGCRAIPSANTPACTIAQTRLDGAPATVDRDGVIRRWTVRGANGSLALQVIRRREGGSYVAGFSQPVAVGPFSTRSFPAELAVREGDTIGVRLGPGATIGSHPGTAGAAATRWEGGLVAEPRPAGEPLAGAKLMVRAEIDPGERPDGPRLLTGAEVASAPAGRVLGKGTVAPAAGTHFRVAVVELPAGIAIDILGDARLSRLEVPDADPDGEFVELTQNCGPAGGRGLCLRWQNPGEELPLVHEYLVRPDGQVELKG